MRIYNTLNARKEDLKTIEPGKVKMYVCGPTVYNLIHIGNARPMIVFDTFRRYLEYKGYHPYIDGRAEVFLKDNNGEFDYLAEYNEVMNGKLYYKDFVNKYNFNYLIVSDREQLLRMSLKNDNDYTILLDSEEITLFRLND